VLFRSGAEFTGRISGVTRFGLFIRLSDTGADGLIPIATLDNDYYHHDEGAHALIGERTGTRYRIGDPVRVRLEEATPVTGGLRFTMLAGGTEGKGKRRGTNGGRPNSGPGGGKKTYTRGGRPKRAASWAKVEHFQEKWEPIFRPEMRLRDS